MEDVGKILLFAGSVGLVYWLVKKYKDGGSLPIIPQTTTTTNNNSNNNTNSNENESTNSNSEYYLTLQQVIAIEQAHPDWQGKVLENKKYNDYQVGFYYNKELMDWGDISKDTFNILVERGYKVLQYVNED